LLILFASSLIFDHRLIYSIRYHCQHRHYLTEIRIYQITKDKFALTVDNKLNAAAILLAFGTDFVDR
jgi:hypothetical protein